jgi:RNA polymerase sigma-70 factor (ECF subfamily)
MTMMAKKTFQENTTNFTDDDLFAVVRKAMRGDTHAFEELLTRKMPTITYHVRMILTNESDVEDTIQEIALTMYKNIKKLKDEKAINIWLQRIITSKSYDHIKKNARHDGLENIENLGNIIVEENKEFLPSEILENDAAKKLVREALDELPPQRKRAITLYYFEDMSYKEIAEIMDVAVSSVSTAIMRGKDSIKEKLAEANFIEGITPLLAGVSIPTYGVTVVSEALSGEIAGTLSESQISSLVADCLTFINTKSIITTAIVGKSAIIKGTAWTIASTAAIVTTILVATGNLTAGDDKNPGKIPVVPPPPITDPGPTETDITPKETPPIVAGKIDFIEGGCKCGHLNPHEATLVGMNLENGQITWAVTNDTEDKLIKLGEGAVAPNLLNGNEGTLPDGDYVASFTFIDEAGQQAFMKRTYTIDTNRNSSVHYE